MIGRLTGFLAAILVAAALAGCGGEQVRVDSGGGAQTSPQQETVEMTIETTVETTVEAGAERAGADTPEGQVPEDAMGVLALQYEYINAGDYESAYSLFVEQNRQEVSLAQYRAFFKANAPYSVTNYSFSPAQGDPAAVDATFTVNSAAGSEQLQRTQQFVRENGEWRIVMRPEQVAAFTATSDPAGPPPAEKKADRAEGKTKAPPKSEAEPKEEAAQEDSDPNFSDGTHRVGTDIEPGTYRTREGSSGCYYARLSGFSNEMDDLIANGNASGPVVVTVEPSDAGFESKRCGTWTQDLSAITESKTSFEEGTYIVGTDIEPGTYRSSGSSGCYYARLSGFGGGMEGVIANDNADAPTVVTIAPTDAGFQSQRCGTWSKIE